MSNGNFDIPSPSTAFSLYGQRQAGGMIGVGVKSFPREGRSHLVEATLFERRAGDTPQETYELDSTELAEALKHAPFYPAADDAGANAALVTQLRGMFGRKIMAGFIFRVHGSDKNREVEIRLDGIPGMSPSVKIPIPRECLVA